MTTESSYRKYQTYHKIMVMLTNGEKFEVYTTWGKDNDSMMLDIDPYNHPAWKKESGTITNTKNDVIIKFNKKHGDVFNS